MSPPSRRPAAPSLLTLPSCTFRHQSADFCPEPSRPSLLYALRRQQNAFHPARARRRRSLVISDPALWHRTLSLTLRERRSFTYRAATCHHTHPSPVPHWHCPACSLVSDGRWYTAQERPTTTRGQNVYGPLTDLGTSFPGCSCVSARVRTLSTVPAILSNARPPCAMFAHSPAQSHPFCPTRALPRPLSFLSVQRSPAGSLRRARRPTSSIQSLPAY